MSLKLKILGLGVLAVMATSAFAVMNASASPGGHFVSEVAHTHIVGTEVKDTPHILHFAAEQNGATVSANEYIGCDTETFTGTATTQTSESITITPTYGANTCYTTGTPNTKFSVDAAGCTYTFTVTKGTTDTTEQEVHLFCDPTKGPGAITITHPNCNITVDSQTVPKAVTYTKKSEVISPGVEKDYITMDVNATFATTYHSGICIFLGTNHFGELFGSVTVRGFDNLGNQVGVTAT